MFGKVGKIRYKEICFSFLTSYFLWATLTKYHKWVTYNRNLFSQSGVGGVQNWVQADSRLIRVHFLIDRYTFLGFFLFLMN